DGELELVEIENPNRYQLELENLAGAIRGEEEPLLGRDDALGQAGAIEALYRAAETAQVVSVATLERSPEDLHRPGGRFRRTRGRSPHVLTVGAAESAPLTSP